MDRYEFLIEFITNYSNLPEEDIDVNNEDDLLFTLHQILADIDELNYDDLLQLSHHFPELFDNAAYFIGIVAGYREEPLCHFVNLLSPQTIREIREFAIDPRWQNHGFIDYSTIALEIINNCSNMTGKSAAKRAYGKRTIKKK
jgi:hypothetical protein